jgi:serine/threonine protein kinase
VPGTCLDETQVLAFVANDLPAGIRQTLEDHVDDCATCRMVLSELIRARGAPRGHTTELADEWGPGARVGRYVVLARIGSGGMGTVFRAEDVELGRVVALKRLHSGADSAARARLVREARSAAQLQHPNVVTVHEVGEDGGTPFLAMELVDGVTLTVWLRERPRAWQEIVGVIAQAGRGLAAAHERGIVHRDFKADNVLVDRTGRARVADFGLARASEQLEADEREPSADAGLAPLTATGALAGTPAFMAPELVEGAAPDARTDQYAFAVTLHEALRGQHPFAGKTAQSLWAEMASGRIRDGGRPVPAWLDRHVRRGLAVEPAARWSSVASFADAIEKPPVQRMRRLAIGVALALTIGAIVWSAATWKLGKQVADAPMPTPMTTMAVGAGSSESRADAPAVLQAQPATPKDRPKTKIASAPGRSRFSRENAIAALDGACHIPYDAAQPDPAIRKPMADWGKVTKVADEVSRLRGTPAGELFGEIINVIEVAGQRGTYRFDSDDITLGRLVVNIGDLVVLCVELQDLSDRHGLPGGPLTITHNAFAVSRPPRITEVADLKPRHVSDLHLSRQRSSKHAIDLDRRYLVRSRVETRSSDRFVMRYGWILDVPKETRGGAQVVPGKSLWIVVEKPEFEALPDGNERIVVQAVVVIDDLFP